MVLFLQGGSGYASVPRKSVIRNLATKFPVFITNECNTSKKCPISFVNVSDVKKEENNETKSSGDRLRKCATINEDTATETVEESSSDSDVQERDRDCIGSVNINQKGIYILLGNPITHFEYGS